MKAETLDSRLSPRGKILLPLGLVLLVGFSVHRLFFAAPPPGSVEFAGPTMGTTWSVKLDAERLSGEVRSRIARAIQGRLDEVNGLMSTYDPGSELSRFNASESTDPIPMSALTLEVFEVARQVSEATGGALDVTVGPLVEAWGFGAAPVPPEPPPSALLEDLASRVGFGTLTIDRDAGTLAKSNAWTVADLSAVAKGFAVDRVAEALVDMGYPSFLVEVGGELRAGAAKTDGTPWRVAIETPDAGVRAIYGVVELVGQGVATSGDYRNFYELNGVEYAHLIDPRTSRPVGHAGTSVTVLDARAAVADAWATGLSVLGPEEGFEVAEREGLAALFIMRDGEEFHARATTAFRKHHKVPGSQG